MKRRPHLIQSNSNMSQDRVVIVGACRTAVGSMMGALNTVLPAKLDAAVISEAAQWAGIEPNQIDEVIMGGLLTGAFCQNIARQSSILAGVPLSVPAYAVSKVCSAGLKSVILATKQFAATMPIA